MVKSKGKGSGGKVKWAGKKIVARMKNYRGAPTIFVNGEPIQGNFVGTRGGAHLLDARPEGVCTLNESQNVFIGPDGDFDASNIETAFNQLFEEQPQACGCVVLGLRPSREWIAANPGETPVASWPIDWRTHNRPDASWASEVWRRDSAKAVGDIAARLHKIFSGRIIIYQVGGGRCGENGPQIHVDYSKPLLRHLRAWLRQRYKNDIKKLRLAWSDSKVTFETAKPPTELERMSSEWFAFRSPRRRQAADYFEAYSLCVVANVRAWMEAIKKATNNESLTASPSATGMDTGLHTDLHGHLPKNRVREYLQIDALDMVESPASYTYRDLGRGDTTFMQVTGSVQLADRMQLRDYDDRTHLTAWKAEEFPKCRLWEPPRDTWGDEQLMLRNTAYSLMKSGAVWWHELEKGMFRLPEHVEIARRLQAMGQGVVHADRRMVKKGMAVFVQLEANFMQASSNRLIFPMNYAARQFQWAHAGMASNIFLLDDATHPRLPAPKVIMVTNAFLMSHKEAESLKALARKNKATIVWLVAPGVQQPKGFDLKHTSRITGFNIKALNIETLPRITMSAPYGWKDGKKHAVKTKLGAVTWPEERPVSSFGAGPFDADDMSARGVGPIFYADVDKDSDALVLGELDFAMKPGLVLKEMDGYRSLYCSAPYLHKALLRQIGKECKAHIYLDTDDLVHVSRELLLVNARREGEKIFNWPRKVEVVMDLYSGRQVAKNCKHWKVKLRKYETRFYFAGTHKVAGKIRDGMKKNLPLF